ncbi:unnamed protein product, partial [Chrysoparadoxa australica]
GRPSPLLPLSPSSGACALLAAGVAGGGGGGGAGCWLGAEEPEPCWPLDAVLFALCSFFCLLGCCCCCCCLAACFACLPGSISASFFRSSSHSALAWSLSCCTPSFSLSSAWFCSLSIVSREVSFKTKSFC